MTRVLCMIAIMLTGHILPLSIAAETEQFRVIQEASDYEIRSVQFAEHLIIIELARRKSISLRNLSDECIEMCTIGYLKRESGVNDDFARSQCAKMCISPPNRDVELNSLGSITELSIALLGLDANNIASNAFVRLLGIRLDAVDSEDFTCVIAIRGKVLRNRLIDINTREIAESCKSNFEELRKRVLRNISDVPVEQICRSEAEIRRYRNEILAMIKSGRTCKE